MKTDILKESETIELKKSLTQLDDALKTICGFLNHKGGKVYFGVDNSGKVLGLGISEKTLRDISQQIAARIKPDISPQIRIIEKDGRQIIEIEVSEGASKPYFLNGIAYKKVGVEKRIMPPDELRSLFNEQRQNKWDSEICEGAALRDIDYEFIKETFIPLYETALQKQVAGEVKDILLSLGCLKNNKPTNAGILLFGKNPQKFFMNSYIALARYKEKEIGPERLDYKEFSGNLIQQIDNSTAYIIEHTDMMSRLLPGVIQRMDIPEYGLFSIRELITNAICHRDYENQNTKIIIKMFPDRMEFYNPGGLFTGINARNITSKQFSRNPTIANALAKIEYIEEMGEGWDKIIKEHREHPLKPKMPKIDADEYTFLVNIYSTKDKFLKEESQKWVVEKVTEKVTENQRKILEAMKENPDITIAKLSEIIGISNRKIQDNISKLKVFGMVKRIGPDKGGHWEVMAK